MKSTIAFREFALQQKKEQNKKNDRAMGEFPSLSPVQVMPVAPINHHRRSAVDLRNIVSEGKSMPSFHFLPNGKFE